MVKLAKSRREAQRTLELLGDNLASNLDGHLCANELCRQTLALPIHYISHGFPATPDAAFMLCSTCVEWLRSDHGFEVLHEIELHGDNPEIICN